MSEISLAKLQLESEAALATADITALRAALETEKRVSADALECEKNKAAEIAKGDPATHPPPTHTYTPSDTFVLMRAVGFG